MFLSSSVLDNIIIKFRVMTSVQFSCSVMSDSLRPPWTATRQASLSITNSQSLLKLMFIELVIGLVYAAAAKLCLTL